MGPELGQMKLEHAIAEGYFAGHGRYALKDQDGTITLKHVGYKGTEITLEHIRDLALYGVPVEVNTTRWYRHPNAGSAVGGVTTRKINLTLKTTITKRIKISYGGLTVGSIPFLHFHGTYIAKDLLNIWINFYAPPLLMAPSPLLALPPGPTYQALPPATLFGLPPNLSGSAPAAP